MRNRDETVKTHSPSGVTLGRLHIDPEKLLPSTTMRGPIVGAIITAAAAQKVRLADRYASVTLLLGCDRIRRMPFRL